MRRIYRKTKGKSDKRIALEERVFEQMREARAALSPEVLKLARDSIRDAGAEFLTGTEHEKVSPPENEAAVEATDGDYVVFDKQKTYETILKFIGMRNFSRDFMREVSALLEQNRPN